MLANYPSVCECISVNYYNDNTYLKNVNRTII